MESFLCIRTRMNITSAIQQHMTIFTYCEADGIRRLPHRWRRVVDVIGDYFESL